MCNLCNVPTENEITVLSAIVDQQLARATESIGLVVSMAEKTLPTVKGNTTHAFAVLSASFVREVPDFDPNNPTQLLMLDTMVAAALQLAKLKAAGYTLIEEMPAL